MLTIQEHKAQREAGKDNRKHILSSLAKAKEHSQNIRLHTEADVTGYNIGGAYSRFLSRVRGYLVESKFDIFKKYHTFPMGTTSVCSEAVAQLSKVFDGKNAVRTISYENEKLEDDFTQYLKETNFTQKWRTDSICALGQGVNDILVVDMPADTVEGLPNPYFYFLDISSVLDLDTDRDGNLLFVYFQQSENEIVYISTNGWQVLETKGEEIISVKREAQNPVPGMSLCRFWSVDNLRKADPIVKKSPFSEWVAKLDWLETWNVWKKQLDAFGVGPVAWTLEEDCVFEDKIKGVKCEGGYLKRGSDFVRGGDSSINHGYEPCPACSSRRFVGPQSLMEIQAPRDGGSLSAPFGFVTIPAEALKNAKDEQERLTDEIIKGVTGAGNEPMGSEAINERQVKAYFEGWTGKLRQIKKSFEESEAWLLERLAALRYGADLINVSLNYGTEFYLMSESDALAFYSAAREVGLPDYILDFLLEEYYKTKFRNDPKGWERVRVLMNVEPLKHVTKKQAIELQEKGLASIEDVRLKLEFGSLVQRFERENGSVSMFGVAIGGQSMDKKTIFAKRVEKIKEVLVSYLPEISTNNSQ